jgi:hypothetical protein
MLFIMAISLVACAQVPKESVELSATVGRDIQKAQESHLELAKVLFDRMKFDVNRFVDEEYAPFQIQFLFKQQASKATQPGASPENSMLLLIPVAFSDEGTADHQDAVVELMSKFSMAIRADVEHYRRKLLQPLEQQEAEVIGSIKRHYQQLHRANSIVTGFLSSVANVHQVQNELLEAFGADTDLREVAGTTLAQTSIKLNKILEKAGDGEVQLDEVEGKIKKIVDKHQEQD